MVPPLVAAGHLVRRVCIADPLMVRQAYGREYLRVLLVVVLLTSEHEGRGVLPRAAAGLLEGDVLLLIVVLMGDTV